MSENIEIQKSLANIRQRLLDLSKRNPLLNYKERARTIPITSAGLNQTFTQLVVQGQSLTLGAHDSNSTPQSTLNLGDETTLTILPTPYSAEILARRCKKLLQEARIALEETGANILYLAMGFLEWFEDQHALVPMRAPLILIPVRLERLETATLIPCYQLSVIEDEIETNTSLAEKLLRHFQIRLPIFTHQSLNDYFAQVAQVSLPHWQFIFEQRLDLFSFTKLMMYKDLDDSNWPSSAPLSHHPQIQRLLSGTRAEPPTVDPLVGPLPWVLEADSSQHAVITEVLRKQANLVVEGPPGTGKSQTITHLIAAALGQNKTVLFVAEKKAALEVVKRRLTQVGLAPFCLALSSHKMQKTEIHAELKARLTQDYTPAQSLEADIQTVHHHQQRLLNYAQLMNTRIGPEDERIYELFWKVERLYAAIEGQPLPVAIPQPRQITLNEFNTQLTLLTQLSEQYQQISAEFKHCWLGFKPHPLVADDTQQIQAILTQLYQHTIDYKNYLEQLILATQLPLTPTLAQCYQLLAIDSRYLAEPPEGLDSEIVLQLPTQVNALEQFYADQNRYQQLLSQARLLLDTELSTEVLEQLAALSDQLQQLGLGNDSPQELHQLVTQFERLTAELQALRDNPDSVKDFLRFLTIRTLAQQAPPDSVLHQQHALAITPFVLEDAEQTFTQLSQRWQAFQEDFMLTRLPDVETLRLLATTWRQYQNHGFAWFSWRYWRTRRSIQRFLAQNALLRQADCAQHLEALAHLIEQTTQASQHSEYQHLLGHLFVGLETDWPQLQRQIRWAQQLSEVLNSEAQAQKILAEEDDPGGYLLKTTAVIHEQWLRVTKIAERLQVPCSNDLLVNEFVEHLFKRHQQVKAVLSPLAAFPQLADKHIISIHSAAEAVLTARQLQAQAATDARLKQLFQEQFQGIDTDILPVLTLARWVTQLPFPAEFVRWLLSTTPLVRLQHCQSLLQRNQHYLTQLSQMMQQLTQFGDLERQQWLDPALTLEQFIAKLHSCDTTVPMLHHYAQFYELKQQVEQYPLHAITEALVTDTIQPHQAPLQFEYAVYLSIARALVDYYPTLATFSRSRHEYNRQQFAAHDQKLMHAWRQQLAYQIAQRPIPAGVSTGKVSNFTERYLIEHELKKKKRHIPIRQLIQRAGLALQAMQPCFMMSPLAVAYYLPAGQIEFDLLIIDEASQVRPEEALTAVARCRQLVIVGDAKQLPPSHFFERLNAETDNSEFEAQESILDLGLKIYPQKQLQWHYRSEHERLIAFSNTHFYDHQLIIFPTPIMNASMQGIQRHYLAQATYAQGCNLEEAKAIVAAIGDHFRHRAQLSLGVATFNQDQQALISDLLEQRCQQDTQLGHQIQATEATAEPFFIKNLENVQGDERDVMFVSTTYGPDPQTGRIFQRFGPIATEQGWRRLNVIFTRAKKQLILFTSLRAEDIQIKKHTQRGIRILKAYLAYVETGALPAPATSAASLSTNNDFVTALTPILEAQGYGVVANVGVGQFRLDLGVYDPQNPQQYLLGIEYDGAYYQAAGSVRDRDYLRPTILHQKGWRLHRIWSVEWFKNRQGEIERLLQALALAKAALKSKITVDK